MKKLFMILLVFVCSIVLCVSVFAVEAQACEDDGCTAEAVHEEEVAETASARGACSHNNFLETGNLNIKNRRYGGPSMCMYELWTEVQCQTCGAIWDDCLWKTAYEAHVWGGCEYEVAGCTACQYCGYHTRHIVN